MRSPCQLREPGPSHCQIAAKGRDASLPNLRPCWPLRTSWSRLVRGCSPPLRQPFLFKGDLPQDLPEQREGERRRKGGACRDQSREKRPPPSPPRGGRRACPAQAGHPLPASCCRATVHAPLKATPRPRQAVLLTRPSRHPLSHRRGTGWEGCLLTPGFGTMPTCSRPPAAEAAGRGTLAGPALGESRGVQGGLISHTFLC